LDIEFSQKRAQQVAEFMKCFGSEHRLLILCQLVEGEKSVTELIEATGMAQTSMSQHLNKLRREGLIDFKRQHRILYYSIVDQNALKIMQTLYEAFCKDIKQDS